MKKRLKYQIWGGVIYILIVLLIIFLIVIFEWTWMILVWVITVPVFLYLAGLAIVYFTRKPLPKEEFEGEKEDKSVDIDAMSKFIIRWRLQNNEVADLCKNVQIEPYTPQQEGENKLTVYKARCESYWHDDILFVATRRDKQKILMYRTYKKDDETAEEDFAKRIDKIVVNPIRIAETETVRIDPLTGAERVIRTKTPVQYLQEREQKKQAKKEEEEEGASGE